MPMDLTGDWDVYHSTFDSAEADTFYLAILQKGVNVFFLEDIDTISTGIVTGDTIRCGDMYSTGISMIFIDDEDHMHSETPLLEPLNPLEFVRQPQ